MLNKNKSRIKFLCNGLLLAFIITIILLVIFSLLLRFTSISETKLPSFNNITMIISIVLASIYVAIKIKEKGWINGAIIGLVYYLIIILINVVFIRTDNSSLLLLTKLVLSGITGVIGGMIGINLA